MANTEVSADTMVRNTGTLIDGTAATVDVAGDEEKFELEFGKPDQDVLVIVSNPSGTASTEDITVTLEAEGEFWAAKAADVDVNVVGGTMKGFVLESAVWADYDGVIYITLTPKGGKKLVTDSAAVVYQIELP